MMARRIIAIALLYVSIVILTTSCSGRNKEYHSAVLKLPNRINPIDVSHGYALYILKQLYEPIFSHYSADRPYSNILKYWKVSDNQSRYFVCLKDNLSFSNGRLLTPQVLKENIEIFGKRGYLKKRLSAVDISNECLDIVFNESYPQFAFDLMSYRTSPVDPNTMGDDIVVGISPYRVVEIKPEFVHLRTDEKLKFKDVYFHLWSPEDKTPVWEYYDDINGVLTRFTPREDRENVDKYMNRYEVGILGVSLLLINHESPLVRSYLFNCIDYSRLRSILNPWKDSFRDIGGIIPVGLPGAIDKPVKQNCPTARLKERVNVYMPTFFRDRAEELQMFFKESLTGLNINVEVEPIDTDRFVKIIVGDKNYDMTVIASVGPPYPAAISYFDYFMPGESMWTRIRNTGVEDIVKEYHVSTGEEKRNELIKEANTLLIKNHQFLPLFQVERPLYFSKKIKAIPSDQLFRGIPKIAEF